jgi:soluble lytic murein transglycosylase
VNAPVDQIPGRVSEEKAASEALSLDSRPLDARPSGARALRHVAGIAVLTFTLLLTPGIPCPDLSDLGIGSSVLIPACVTKSLVPVGPDVAVASRPPRILSEVSAPLLDRAAIRSLLQEEGGGGRKSSEKSRVTTIYEALSDCRASLSEPVRWRIARAIEEQSRRHGYDPLFVQAMVEVESTCSPTARSRRGAIGLIQLRPASARAVAEAAGGRYAGPQTLLDPVRNVELGLLYLNQLEEQLGDPHLAVAAYNLGPGRVAGMSKSFAKTARYVRKILARYEHLLAESTSA